MKPHAWWMAAGIVSLVWSGLAHGEESWVKVGGVVRGDMSITLGGGSHTQNIDLGVRELYKQLPPGVGPRDRYADREYENGFVRMDIGTGDPNTIEPNTTWYWGYQSASQVRDGFLTYERSGGREVYREEVRSEESSGVAHIGAGGAEVQAGTAVWRWGENARLDAAAGLRLFAAPGRKVNDRPYEDVHVRRYFSVRDSYDIQDIPVPPAAPYAGTFWGPFDNPPVIPSPIIANLPDRRSEHDLPSAAERWSTRADVSVEVDTFLLDLRVGPRFAYQLPSGISLHLQPAVTLTLIDLDLTRRETYSRVGADGEQEVIQRWRDTADDQGWRWGAGLEAGATWPLHGAWSLQINVGADWVRSMEARVGPSTIHVDVSGYSAGVAVVRTFGRQAAEGAKP